MLVQRGWFVFQYEIAGKMYEMELSISGLTALV